MSCITNHQNEQIVRNNTAVTKLYLSRLLEGDDEGILITSLKRGYETENIIPLKLNHSNNFGLLQLSYRGPTFQNYFPSNAIITVREILLKKSTTENHEFSLEDIKDDLHNGDWDIIHIKTEIKSDCNYLFKKAIEDNCTVILAIQFEIVDPNNSLQLLTLYPHGVNSPLLHRAVAEKDIKIIKALVDYKLNVNARNKAGWPLLLVAVNLEMPDVVDLLTSNGADVNIGNKKRQAALHIAAEKNNLEILNNLLTNQAKLDEKDMFRQTPLFYAVNAGNVNAVDILLKKGADYKLTDEYGRTAFHLAAKQQNLDIIEVFLRNNVDADILNLRKQTPLFFVSETSFHTQSRSDCRETYIKIINALLRKGANINFQDADGRTPLHQAVINDNITFMQILLKYNADISILTNSKQDILHIACWHQANKCIPVLLNFNIDINAVDIRGKSALHITVETKNHSAVEMIWKKNPSINMSDELGKTALHLAIESESLPIIEFLLKNKADVNLRDALGKTALHIASASANITINVIKSILNSTNDINAKDNIGRTAVHYAALNHNVTTLRCLLEKNANVNAKDSEGKTPLHVTMNSKNNYFECVKVLLDHKADINAVDNNLTSPLHLAFFVKNAEIVKYLIENGADSNMKDKDERTVFHYTCIVKLNGISFWFVDNIEKHIEDILIVLMKENISVNCCDIFGRTPLHYAPENDRLCIINKLLLNIGADINIVDKDNNTAFDELIKRSSHIRYDSSVILYEQHIVKMKVLKLWVREKILDQIYKVDGGENLQWIQSYERDCSREINLMKSTYLNESKITYYDFLKKSPHDAVNYTRNHNSVNAIQSYGLIIKFPIYGYFLKNHLRETQQRRNLYDQIQESLKSYVFTKLPTLCMYEILGYLDHSELIVFLKAMKRVVLDN